MLSIRLLRGNCEALYYNLVYKGEMLDLLSVQA